MFCSIVGYWELEKDYITKEEEILLSYYRNSSEQDKTTILHMVERLSRASKN